jgi:hypothetical protein
MLFFVNEFEAQNTGFCASTSLLVGAVLLYPIATAIYNLFFHPLRSYPGPLLWRMSSIPWRYHHVKGDRTHIQAQFHLKYGDVVRIRPGELSYTSFQAWDDIFAHHPNRPEFPKDPRRQRRNPNKLEVHKQVTCPCFRLTDISFSTFLARPRKIIHAIAAF